MSKQNCIHLVIGVSSVGKSTYIESRIKNKEWDNLPILMAYELDDSKYSEQLNQECIVHYNLLRPFDNNAANIDHELFDDPILKDLLNKGERVKVYMLVAHRSEILKRCLLRMDVEKNLKGTKSSYPHQNIFELMCRLNLSALYKQYCMIFEQYGISLEVVNCSNDNNVSINSVADALSLLDDHYRVQYSKEETDYIVETNHFEYQKSMINGNQYTEGQDRSDSLKYLDKDLTGKSLLDIGCAYGFFCFEAENRNAMRVMGTELKRHRYIGFNILKEIHGQKSTILYQDVFNEPIKEKFDIVLLLNVIHHLKEPIRALRLASLMCTEKLIIEFPTLSDEKFTATLPWWMRWKKNQLFGSSGALIGVSLLKDQDQTFLFSEEAIKRILLEHEKLFSKIEFHQSPMSKSRKVAICYK